MKDNVVNEATFSITHGHQKLNEYNDQPDTETKNAQSTTRRRTLKVIVRPRINMCVFW